MPKNFNAINFGRSDSSNKKKAITKNIGLKKKMQNLITEKNKLKTRFAAQRKCFEDRVEFSFV